jgi:type I restriction enzyme R subunit
MASPEAEARKNIDRQLEAAGWIIQDRKDTNLAAGPGVAVREFPTETGPVDYGLYVERVAAGAVEAKKEGTPLIGVEVQNRRYSHGLPSGLPAYRRPLPFLYESTGTETHFTNLLEPDARAREVFCFHRPETMRAWLSDAGYTPGSPQVNADDPPPAGLEASTVRGRLKQMPFLNTEALWSPQKSAILNLERSLAENRQRSLIQMATGSGKTFAAANFVYRLAKHAKAKRILFLVDRANLGRQTEAEFSRFSTPDDGRKFTELYVFQRLTSNHLDPTAKVVVSTIQRLYSMLRGEADLDPELEEASAFNLVPPDRPLEVEYNPAIPIETFDFIVTDECHRSIYNLWAQVLTYFDAFLIGLTATPSKQTLGFFDQNLVMEYGHEQAVADGVNVDFDVFSIQTEITQKGSTVDAGFWVEKRERETRRRRAELMDEDLTYAPEQLDRDVVAKDQIRTVIQTFRDRLFTEMFPGRTDVPKTLIFAKDDSHAEDIVQIVREEFGKGNDFCQKITYKTTGKKPETLLQEFRNSYDPRIAVTVDMIATGTDVKPLEIVFFMRQVRSRIFFEQMKGRGVRIINPSDLQVVTPDAKGKDRFVIVDAVGLSQENMIDTAPMERKPAVSLKALLDQIAFGSRDEEVLSSVASRIARLDKLLTRDDRDLLRKASGGLSLSEIAHGIVEALDPDVQIKAAQEATGDDEPTAEARVEAALRMLDAAAAPLATSPELRNKLVEVRKSYEQTIDIVSKDHLIFAGFSEEATEAARTLVDDFETYIRDNKDEITALQVLYAKPYGKRLSFEEVKELAESIRRPPRSWTPELLWSAYEKLDASRVHGAGPRVLADLVSLVRFALEQEAELVPFPEHVQVRFAGWLAEQENVGKHFTAEQLAWLEMIAAHVATSLSIGRDDFDYAPFVQEGGLGKAHEVFGEDLGPLLDDLNGALPQ